MTRDIGAAIRVRLAGEGLVAGAWSNEPGDRYAAHRHEYDKVLVAAAGSIEFLLPELGGAAELTPGDRLDLPAGTLHAALVGSLGVTCLEAHLVAGTLTAGLRQTPGWAAQRPTARHAAGDAGEAAETDPVGAA